MKKALLFATLIAGLSGFINPLHGGQETMVSAAVGGIFPPGASFGGVPITGLEAGFGLELEDGSALGEFCVLLVGVASPLTGLAPQITVTGVATAGTRTAENVATFSGTCTVDLGNGTAPQVAVPFTASVVIGANDQGTLGLAIGTTTLPNATISEGSMTISVPPTVTPPSP